MKRFFQLFTQPWFLSLLGVLLLCLIIWYIGPLIAIAEYKPLSAEWVRLSIVFVALILWGLNNLRKKTKTNQATDKLANAIAEDAKPAASKTKKVPSADEQILESNLQKSLGLLQGSGFGKDNKLYKLPWYMVIGAPGSGKTTALKNSGLNFPLQNKLGEAPIQGEGGTRYCDWWFTEEAILIDTAGRYTTQDNPQTKDSEAWLGFLARLKKARPKQPLNGIIVTVSIQDILQKTPTQKALQATAIKQRVQELNNHLNMKIPVYLVLSKLDMVAGFNSFFSDLEAQDREQAWGFTYSQFKAGDISATEEVFNNEFDLLLQRLEDRVLSRLNSEHSPQKRALIYEFPRQMRALKTEILKFVAPIFTPNQFETPIMWRGLYLLSSTQSNMASRWVTGILPPEQCAPPIDIIGIQPKTYFVNNLLKKVIFAEANLATLNDKMRARYRWIYTGLTGCAIAAFSCLAIAWSHSKTLNKDYIHEIEDQLEQYSKIDKKQNTAVRDWHNLTLKLNLLRDLPTGYMLKDSQYTFKQGFGLYQGNKLGEQAETTYKKALESFFMQHLEEMLGEQLELAKNDDERLYEALKFYLMPYHSSKMDTDSFTLWVNILWERQLPNQNKQVLLSELNSHLKTALSEKVSPFPIDDTKVEMARNILIKTPLDLRVYRRLKNDYMDLHPEEFSIKSVLGKKADAMFYRKSGKALENGIPELFTYSGFHRGFNLENIKLSQRLADEQWIYGDKQEEALTEERIKEISSRVNQYYFNEYIARWDEYLNDVAIQSFGTVNRGQSVVQMLASSDQPLVKLLVQIRKHTALSEAPVISDNMKDSANQLAEEFASSQKGRLERLVPKSAGLSNIKLPGSDVTEHFEDLNSYINTEEGLPLLQLQQALINLDDYFQNLAYSENTKQAAFDASKEWKGGSSPVVFVQRAISDAPPQIETWFSSIARDTAQVTAAATQSHMNNIWQTEVVSFYNRAIKDKYPLNPKSKRDVKLADFTKFFCPAGILDSYYAEYIEPFVDTSKHPWRWKKNIGLSTHSLELFYQAQNIKNAYFSDKSGEPEVAFSMKPHTLDHIASGFLLETAGTTIAYNHGPVRNVNVLWPGEKTDLSKIVFSLSSKGTPISARTEGEWSWFRLLDEHSKIERKKESDGLLVTFELDGIASAYIIQPASTDNPYHNKDVQKFSLPTQL